MATSKDYINFIMEQLSALDGVETRRMMGEYIIYFRGKLRRMSATTDCW